MTTNRRAPFDRGYGLPGNHGGDRWQTSRAAEPVRHRARPNSRINGVQIGVQSYSFRDLPDQTPAGILRYCLESASTPWSCRARIWVIRSSSSRASNCTSMVSG